MSEIINPAPLLSPLRAKGNTFITLSSTINDLNKKLATDNTRIHPSKIAVLNLPKWANLTGEQHMYIDPAENGNPIVTDPNTAFPKFIQNYVENQIQYSESNRTNESYSNFGEVAIWKALQKLGALELVEDGTDVVDGQTVQLYSERDEVEGEYEHVIKATMDVNMTNLVESNGVEYAEYYAYLPNESGKTASIKFGPTDITHNLPQIPDAGGGQYTVGLEEFVTDQNYAIYDTIDNKYEVGDDLNKAKVRFDLSDIENISGDYEFNAILLYYDVYENTDETTQRSNAFGLLLLDRFESLGGGSYDIPRLKKYQPDDVQSGNSYIFKFNHRMATASNQFNSQITFNTYNNVSMEMYMDALRRLTTITESYQSLTASMVDIQQRMDKYDLFMLQYDRLEEQVDDITTNTQRIEQLESANRNEAYIRTTNEELFEMFYKSTQAIKEAQEGGSNVDITMVATSKALLPYIVDTEDIIGEDSEGNKFQWNDLTKTWDQIYSTP